MLLHVVVDVKLDLWLVMSRRTLVDVDVRPLFHILWTTAKNRDHSGASVHTHPVSDMVSTLYLG